MKHLSLYAVLALVIDQASKLWILKGLSLETVGRIEVWPPFLVFQMAWNQGINFGLFGGDGAATRWLLIGVALAICFWVGLWVRRGMNSAGQIFAGLLIGGALGNVLDRVIYGAVVDFLNMSCCGFANPFSFNTADVFVFIGVFGLVLFGKDENAT
ncbi:signal peptidase II [Aliiroseovarius sp.]|uniref:signal peptidase II n=1 Tax=Aliiroseovarius sp. TaxID=1872442 RepID=UPI0026346C6C|nr:signal peptidase II [Aliiroseovarius sp.]